MRILWILPYSPWPTTSGGKTRQYHLLRSLAARGHRITVLLHSKQPVSAEDRQALEPFLERLVVLPRRPLRSLSTLLAALFAPYPLLASVNGLSAELQRTATELLREPWDVVQVEHSYSFQPYERPLRDAGQPFVLTEHNVESSLGAATYDRLPGWALPFVRYDQWRYRRWERRVMSQAAAVVAVTEKDARQLGAMLGRPVPVVVNGVDCEHFAAARPTPEAQRVLFLGNYEYAPNVDAVEWMLDEILPRVWAHCPEARMSVCGYALPAEWAQRWSDPRIEWQGFVPDLLQLQSSSSVFLAALRHGGGSKLKVLEALAAGLPPRYWLLVGTRELRKNVPWFVSAWARARAQAPGVPPLVLVGSLDHLPEEQRGLPGLHALGGLDDAELHALYRQAERLWQPSYAEGFGLPVVEALSVGTPVAVASGTSLDEVTPPSAPRFSPSDGAALERLMLRLADAPREASAEELIAWAARFNREAYRQRLAALIEELS